MPEKIEKLIDLLKERGYGRIRRFPLRKYAPSLPLFLNEIGIIGRFLLNGNNIFSISLAPHLYSKAGLGGDLGFLREAFFLNKDFPIDSWRKFFAEDTVASWEKEGMLTEVENKCRRFNYRIVPYGGFFFLTSRFDRNDPDFTFLSYDSLFFASFLKRRLRDIAFCGDRGIDLCCGVGIQAISVSPFCKNVTGTDINQKAIELARINASFSGAHNCDFIEGPLFEKSEGRFDLIVSNPPFIFFKEGEKGPVDSSGGEPFGLGVTLKILSGLDKYLSRGGRAFVITRSPVLKGRDYLFSNLSKWLPAGFGCVYHYVSDSIDALTPYEKALGIGGYRQVILEVSGGGGSRFLRYPFLRRKTSVF